MLSSIFLYLCIGAVAGILAGLLGVGGGLVIVPLVTYSFVFQGIESDVTHKIALATSLATIMFTSVSSFMAHHRNKAVIWSIFKAVTPGILIGTFLGTKVVTLVPETPLKIFFVCFLYYTASQMFLNIKPKASRQIPGPVGNSAAGLVIGGVSSLVGIGGGTLSVPYMTWCNIPIHKAIGTSAAIGFPIAVAGALGNIVNGWGLSDVDYSLGLIYLPALIGIAAASVCTAPFGAKIAHKLPIGKLKKIFACLLITVATQMLYQLVTA